MLKSRKDNVTKYYRDWAFKHITKIQLHTGIHDELTEKFAENFIILQTVLCMTTKLFLPLIAWFNLKMMLNNEDFFSENQFKLVKIVPI